MGNSSTHIIETDGQQMTVTMEELELEPVGPDTRPHYDGSTPKLSKKDCKCNIDYDNDIWIDHGQRTDTYVYCPKCGCLKNVMGS